MKQAAYLTVSESEPHCEDGGVGGRQGLLSSAASVEFCTAATVAEEGELCFWPEVVALLLTRVTLDELNSRELLDAADDEPLAENCSSRSMSSMKKNHN